MGKRPSVEADGKPARGSATPRDVPELRQLVVAHHEALYRYAYRLAGNTCDAEDLTQQTFLVAQQRLHQVRDPDKVEAWLFAVLRNCYFKGCRKPRTVLATNLEISLEAIPAPLGLAQIDRQTLQAALDELPDAFRIVILMFYFEGCSYKEIASQLEIPIGTVMSRLARAKAHLRRRLSGWEEQVAAIAGPGAGSPLATRRDTERLDHRTIGQ